MLKGQLISKCHSTPFASWHESGCESHISNSKKDTFLGVCIHSLGTSSFSDSCNFWGIPRFEAHHIQYTLKNQKELQIHFGRFTNVLTLGSKQKNHRLHDVFGPRIGPRHYMNCCLVGFNSHSLKSSPEKKQNTDNCHSFSMLYHPFNTN